MKRASGEIGHAIDDTPLKSLKIQKNSIQVKWDFVNMGEYIYPTHIRIRTLPGETFHDFVHEDALIVLTYLKSYLNDIKRITFLGKTEQESFLMINLWNHFLEHDEILKINICNYREQIGHPAIDHRICRLLKNPAGGHLAKHLPIKPRHTF